MSYATVFGFSTIIVIIYACMINTTIDKHQNIGRKSDI